MSVRVEPYRPFWKSVKNLVNRVKTSDVSIDDAKVPAWQRGLIWTDRAKGMLALSIIQGYPIGQIVLWELTDGTLVPVDGRQRISAIRDFAASAVPIPDDSWVVPEFRGRWGGAAGASAVPAPRLALEDFERFEDYELDIIVYPKSTPQSVVMEIFARLQGGTPLTKAEIRSALGGELCDFISELTSANLPVTDEVELDEDEESASPTRHRFFELLRFNLQDRRKAHRGVCDALLCEYLTPGGNQHWETLLEMYRVNASGLATTKRTGFRKALSQFTTACTVKTPQGLRLCAPVRPVNAIVTFFRVWRTLQAEYVLPAKYSFAKDLIAFDRERLLKQRTEPWAANYGAALSNAGYAQARSNERYNILLSWLLRRHPGLESKDPRRVFTTSQKQVIFARAEGRCEYTDEQDERCLLEFARYEDADADHIKRWVDGGKTTVENGRLLCVNHNRSGVANKMKPAPAVVAAGDAGTPKT
jgi:hypothetical protein